VIYADPTITGGKVPYVTKCTPISGSQFLVGDSTVNCQTTDAQPKTASCSFNVHVAAPPRISVTNFDAYGDSITFGEDGVNLCPINSNTALFSARCKVSLPYPDLLRGLLQQRYTAQSSSFFVVNSGQTGDTPNSPDPGKGLSRFNATVPNHVPTYQVLLLMLGANNVPDPGTWGAAISAMRTMIQTAQSAGIRVLLATLPPEDPGIVATDGTHRGQSDSQVQQFNALLISLASETRATLVDVHQAFPPTSTYLSDGLHPTQLGYVQIADNFFTVIRNTFEVSVTTTSLGSGLNPDALGLAIRRRFEPSRSKK